MSVLLGLCDEEITNTNLTSWTINKIGGKPDWIQHDIETPKCRLCGRPLRLTTQLYCPLEQSIYHRVLHIFGCINKMCWNKSESWRVYRSQQRDNNCQTENTKTPMDDWGTDADDWGDGENTVSMATGGAASHTKPVTMETKEEQWCEGADDWGDEDDETAKFADSAENDKTTIEINSSVLDKARDQTNLSSGESKSSDESLLQLRTMVIDDDENEENGPKQVAHVIPENTVLQPSGSLQEVLSSSLDKGDTESETLNDASSHFRSYYINVFEEFSAETVTCTKYEKKLIDEYNRKEGRSLDLDAATDAPDGKRKSKGSSGAESYEKVIAKHGDRIFQKFIKQISTYPQQIIRYWWDGKPLFVSAHQQSPVPRCSCGCDRVFEVQLMPALVTLLRMPQSSECQLEFGVVIVYTCKNSCWTDQDTLKEEHVTIQSDPDQHLFKT